MENLIQRAARNIIGSTYTIALTGAGMSTESGIPDFRGPKGIWTTDKGAEAKAYERYDLFLRDPKSYWQEMSGFKDTHGEFYSRVRGAAPNPGHHALAELGRLGFVKSVLTQNIDGLHEKAGSENVVDYHGSVQKLRCASCGARFKFGDVSLEQLPPYCKCGGIIKYDVVHFKEAIPTDVMDRAEKEALECDLMLICGTSAVVYPFASLPRVAKMYSKPKATIVIELNAEPTPLTAEGISDYLIQGNTGEILPAIVDEVKSLS